MRDQRIGLRNKMCICTVVILFLVLTFGISSKASAVNMSYRTGSYEYSATQTGQTFTIYRRKFTSAQKQKLTTVQGSWFSLQKVYNDSLYFEVGRLDHSDYSDVWMCNIKTKRKKCLKQNVEVAGKNGKYLCVATNAHDPAPLSFWVYNMRTQKCLKTNYNVFNTYKAKITGDKLYYARMVGKNRDANGCYTFQIRCKNLKTGKENYVVKSFKAAGIKEITAKYVKYYLPGNVVKNKVY